MPSILLGQFPQIDYGTGVEWLIAFSVLAPIVLLILILWYGQRNTV